MAYIGEHETLAATAKHMRELGVGALPVWGDDDRLHGMVTDRDIVIKCIATGHDPNTTTAAGAVPRALVWDGSEPMIRWCLRDHPRPCSILVVPMQTLAEPLAEAQCRGLQLPSLAMVSPENRGDKGFLNSPPPISPATTSPCQSSQSARTNSCARAAFS